MMIAAWIGILICLWAAAQTEAGTVAFSPGSSTVGPRDTFMVEIRVDAAVTGIHCFMVTVAFDQSLVELLTVTEGTLLPPVGQTFFFWNANGDAYDIGDCLMGYGLQAGGPGLLATMTFRGKGLSGTSPLTFTATQFSDIDLNPITVTTADGVIHLEGNQSPTVTVISPPSGGVSATLPSLQIHFQADGGLNRGYYQIDQCLNAWTELWGYNSGSLDTAVTWVLPSLAEGAHVVHFKVVDDEGFVNLDTCSYAWTMTYDHTRPGIVVTLPPSNGSYATLPTLTLSIHDNLGLDRASWQVDDCHGSWTPVWSYNMTGKDTMATLPLSGLAEGMHTLYFKVIDDAGLVNIDTCSYWWNFTYDITPPTMEVLSPPSGGTYDDLPTLSIVFHDNLGLNLGYYQIDDCHGAWLPLWIGDLHVSDYTYAWTVPDLAAGTHVIYFKILDDAGTANVDVCTYSWQLTYTGLEYTCGDANGDDKINVGDAVFIITYVFRGGPAPVPLAAADANCDGKVNVGDAVYLITYIFRGGPAPCATCP